MKIKSNMKDNFLSIYNEARGIARHKKRVIKTEKINHLNFLEEIVLYYSIIMLMGVYIIDSPMLLNTYGYILIALGLFYLLYNTVRIYEGYKFRKKQNFVSTIIINEKGITDRTSFEGIEILFKWKIIEAVVIKKYAVVILTKKKIYFYFDIKNKESIINEIKKHKKNIKIIDA